MRARNAPLCLLSHLNGVQQGFVLSITQTETCCSNGWSLLPSSKTTAVSHCLFLGHLLTLSANGRCLSAEDFPAPDLEDADVPSGSEGGEEGGGVSLGSAFAQFLLEETAAEEQGQAPMPPSSAPSS